METTNNSANYCPFATMSRDFINFDKTRFFSDQEAIMEKIDIVIPEGDIFSIENRKPVENKVQGEKVTTGSIEISIFLKNCENLSKKRRAVKRVLKGMVKEIMFTNFDFCKCKK